MSAPKFTPGPWEDHKDAVESDHMLDPVARVDGRTWEETLANARLIAAAPDMYEALHAMCRTSPTIGGPRFTFEGARALLARIDGDDR